MTETKLTLTIYCCYYSSFWLKNIWLYDIKIVSAVGVCLCKKYFPDCKTEYSICHYIR